MRVIMGVHSTIQNYAKHSFCAKGELDDNEEDEWKEGGYNEAIDSEGKPMKLTMVIYSRVMMLLRTLFLPKVSWTTMTRMNGGTMMIMNSAIVKVSPMKLILEVCSRIKIILRTLCAKGELDDNEEDDDYEAVDSEGKPFQTHCGDS